MDATPLGAGTPLAHRAAIPCRFATGTTAEPAMTPADGSTIAGATVQIAVRSELAMQGIRLRHKPEKEEAHDLPGSRACGCPSKSKFEVEVHLALTLRTIL